MQKSVGKAAPLLTKGHICWLSLKTDPVEVRIVTEK
jgi:hypothetical protein